MLGSRCRNLERDLTISFSTRCSLPARRCASITGKYLSDMDEELISMEGLTDREILHKMLDKILDSNGKDNTAVWTQFTPGWCGGGRGIQVTYRLQIDAEKTVSYTEL